MATPFKYTGSLSKVIKRLSLPALLKLRNVSVGIRNLALHEVDYRFNKSFHYLMKNPGKKVRDKFIEALNVYIEAEDHHLNLVKSVIASLHNASLLIDDIEDNAYFRRGEICSHRVFGVGMTLNSANFIYFNCMDRIARENCPEANKVFLEEMLELHRGQGLDILSTEDCINPGLDGYVYIVAAKTGGLFRLAMRLLSALAGKKDEYSGFSVLLGVYFQIFDDYLNLKKEGDDITEGKFGFPLVCAMQQKMLNRRDSERLQCLLALKTMEPGLKKEALKILLDCGAVAHTRNVLVRLYNDLCSQLEGLAANPQLKQLLQLLQTRIN
ncbi:hypothetical protein PCE1_000097 [Barthelona sp. PCE]